MLLEFDFGELEAIKEALDATQEQAQNALVRAIRRVTSSVKSRFAKELKKVAGNPRGFEKARLKVRLNKNKMTGIVWAGLDPISFSHFAPKMRAIEGERGVATISPYVPYIPGAFVVKKIGNAKNGKRPVWMRTNKALPTGVVEDRKKSGLDGIRRLASDRLLSEEIGAEKALKVAEERLPKEFEHELRRETSK